MHYERKFIGDIKKQLLDSRGFIQVLTGPRQVGKTTLVQQLFRSSKFSGIYHVVEASSGYDGAWIEAVYNQALIRQGKSKRPVILAIDEVQKLSHWSETVKRLHDEQKFAAQPLQLLLLGSSSWLMQKGLSESLAGRFEQWDITHWTYNEMRDAFGITPEEYVYFGAYPGAIELRHDEARWKSYVRQSLIETVITKDVLLMERIEKPALLRRVFELGSNYSGQILSFTKLMGQLQEAKNTTTIAHYLDLLQRAGLLEGLQKYAVDNARKRNSSPKWQVMNNALLSATSSSNFKETQRDTKRWGRWVESAVGCHLLAHRDKDLQVFYWNESNAEVDYIVKWKNKIAAIEVKTVTDKVTALKKFTQQFRPHKVYQLDSKHFPWQEFITIDPRELF
jgi:predicted AAA+ superfamily ATPase